MLSIPVTAVSQAFAAHVIYEMTVPNFKHACGLLPACHLFIYGAPARDRRCKQMGESCIYSKRRRANRPQTPGPIFVGSASGVSVLAPSPLPVGSGVPAALLHYGRVSLKRSVCLRRVRVRAYSTAVLALLLPSSYSSDKW